MTGWMYLEQLKHSEPGIPETTLVYHFLAFFIAGTFVVDVLQ